MVKQFAVLMLFAASVFPQSSGTEVFSTLDREIAGLMDAWVIMVEGRDDKSAGLFMAGTAILRAETAFEASILYNDQNFPPEVLTSWTAYLKSSADCINIFRKAVGSSDTTTEEEFLLASFARWETTGEEFLESVQSTR